MSVPPEQSAATAPPVPPADNPEFDLDIRLDAGDDPGDRMVINMGPQHPSTHGVLRIVLEVDGERVISAVPDIGYLHRGKEKIAETLGYHRYIPYTDRLDYLAPLANNCSAARAFEKVCGITAPPPGPRRSAWSLASWPGSRPTSSASGPTAWTSGP